MTILCTAPGEFTGDNLIIGRYYQTEEISEGTLKQNSTFHALCQEFMRSGCHSYTVKSFDDFKKFIKRDYGAVYESYVCIEETEEGLIKKRVKKYEDLPECIAVDKDGKDMVWGELKSWKKYTKKQRMETIDRLIAAMIQYGVNTKKFHEILEGMEGMAHYRASGVFDYA